MPVSVSPVFMGSALRRRQHKGSRLNRTGAKQNSPMRFPRLLGEGRRHGDEFRTRHRQRPVERGEAEIVANAEAKTPERQVYGHRLVAALKQFRLSIALATGEIDIEEMQLVVSGGDGPVRSDQVRAVGDTLRPKLDASEPICSQTPNSAASDRSLCSAALSPSP